MDPVIAAYQIWGGGNPPQPSLGEKLHIFVLGKDGNYWHRWWDGSTLHDWENWGHPPTA